MLASVGDLSPASETSHCQLQLHFLKIHLWKGEKNGKK